MARGKDGERGSTLILTLLMMGAMLGMAAIVVDLGFARQLTRQSQGATDAAALAGAQALPCSGDAVATVSCDGSPSRNHVANLDAARNQAVQYLATDLSDDGSFAVTACPSGVATCNKMIGDTEVWVTTPYTAPGAATGVPNYGLIHTKACRRSPTFFAGAIGARAPYVCREAVARKKVRTGGFRRGLVATDPSQCRAMSFAGNSDTVLTSNGAVVVESSCTDSKDGALATNGSSWNLEAGAITVVGSATLGKCSAQCTNGTTPQTGVEPAGDPLGDIVEPAAPAPTFSTVAAACPTIGKVKVCSPGRWTFEFKPGSNDNYLFKPGVYYLDPGAGKAAFDSGGGTSLKSDPAFGLGLGGPLFFVKTGSFTMNGGGAVGLRPYATRPYSGMSMFQARSNAAEMKINGNADFQAGTVYVPQAKLTMLGSGGINITGQVIARTVELTGSVNIDINVVEPPDIKVQAPDLGLER